MDGLLPVALAALAAAGVSWWSYGSLEEPVAGRAGPAVLRGLALFLLLAGWWLPPLPSDAADGSAVRAVLVDTSASMKLPATAGGTSRADSAERLAAAEDASPERRLEFGGAFSSHVVPALEAARAAGADSVVLVTDGELDDREAARTSARRLGLGVREERASAPVGRLAVRGIDAPRTVEAGDTIRLVVELEAVGDAMSGDSASLSVTGPDGVRSIVDFAVPSPGRTRRVPVPVAAGDGSGDPWRAYDVRLEPDADPLASAAGDIRHRTWIEVVPTAAGAVVVAFDPDWEAHYLLPELDRSIEGGATAWFRVGEDRWVRSGTDRLAGGDDGRVRADAARARLLVVQGVPGELPGWLAAVAARHPRVLWLARGAGSVPGSDVRVGTRLPGEWYPGGSPPASPVAGYLDGLDHPALPPVSRLFDVEGHDWVPLELRRNRSGAGRPPVVGDRSGNGRRIIVAAEGLWRWASRGGATREVYRSMIAGLAGWLVEAAERRPVQLERVRLRAADTIRWRLAGEVEELRLTLRDSAGAALWRDTIAVPDSLIVGPPAPEGTLRFEAEGTVSGEPFRVGRPFEAEGAVRELSARPVGSALEGSPLGSGAPAAAAGHPVWPFVLAALMLCGEWYWRRRIGLR